MATTTTQFYIAPEDGWVEIVAGSALFTRVSAYPHTHPYFLAWSSSAPSLLSAAATGSVAFSGGSPSDGQNVAVGPEVWTFRTSPTLPNDVGIGAATPGTASIVFAGGVPTNTQTIIIGTDTYEAVTSGATGLQFNIGGTNLITATNFAAAVNGGSSIITAVDTAGTVVVTSVLDTTVGNYTITNTLSHVTAPAAMTGGQDGSLATATLFAAAINSYSTRVTAVDTAGTVALTSNSVGGAYNWPLTKTATHVTVSGMSGGSDLGSGAALMCHEPFWHNVEAGEPLWARVQNPVPNANNSRGALRLDVMSII